MTSLMGCCKALSFSALGFLTLLGLPGAAKAAMTNQQCSEISREKGQLAIHFGMMLVPYKNAVVGSLNAGGNTAAVKCSYLRRIEVDQAAINRLTMLQLRNCPVGQFLDPNESRRVLENTREAERKYCGSR